MPHLLRFSKVGKTPKPKSAKNAQNCLYLGMQIMMVRRLESPPPPWYVHGGGEESKSGASSILWPHKMRPPPLPPDFSLLG